MQFSPISNWTGDLIITGSFKYLQYYLGEFGTFTLFGFNGMISWLYVCWLVYETAGKTEIEIAKDYGEIITDPDEVEES